MANKNQQGRVIGSAWGVPMFAMPTRAGTVATMASFVHLPILPNVLIPGSPHFYFHGTTDEPSVQSIPSDRVDVDIEVSRDAREEVAEVRLIAYGDEVDITARMRCDVTRLRELAQRLLDAAYDLQANPANGEGVSRYGC